MRRERRLYTIHYRNLRPGGVPLVYRLQRLHDMRSYDDSFSSWATMNVLLL